MWAWRSPLLAIKLGVLRLTAFDLRELGPANLLPNAARRFRERAIDEITAHVKAALFVRCQLDDVESGFGLLDDPDAERFARRLLSR